MKHIFIISITLILAMVMGACKKKIYKPVYCNPSVAHLESHYSFGGNGKDITGTNSNASMFNLTYGKDQYGVSGSCLYFDGSTSYVLIDNIYDIPKRTFSFWFKVNTFPTGPYPSKDLGVILLLDNANLKNGFVATYVSSSGGKNYITMGIGALQGELKLNMADYASEGGWNHAALVQNVNEVRIFLNGKKVHQTIIPTTGHSVDGDENLILGINRGLNARFFNGSVDGLKIYSRALSDCEVDWLYKN